VRLPKQIRDSSTSLGMTCLWSASTKKPGSKIRSGFLKSYPADAVQADHPFPFSHGWMTVTTASDFQSRPAMFCGRLSLLACINSGSGISPRNLEHRRVNVRSRKSEPIRDRLKSRWSRVERKALVFFPTLNERLCFQRTIPAASLPTRALVARESSRAPRSLPRL
jgi:hypothetical protein